MGSVNQIYQQGEKRWLHDNSCLWRYVPLRTLLFYLTGNIFIPTVETLRLKDPFEGRFAFDTIWFNDVVNKHYGERSEQLDDWIYRTLCSDWERKQIDENKSFTNYAAGIFEQHYFDFLRRTRYAWCWFLSESESAAMWNNYGHQGVAIATRVGRLRGLLEKAERDFVFGQMRYIHMAGGEANDPDFNPEDRQDSTFLLKPHFLKRREYESEKEVRFVTAAPARTYGGGIILENINPVDWIQAIRLWPGLKAPEEESLKKVVAHFAPKVPCACSDLFGADPLSAESITARFVSESNALGWEAWKNNSDDIPSGLKQV